MLKGSTIRYATIHGAMIGVGGTHVVHGTLAQFVGRHYTTQAMPAHYYSIPATTWVPKYVMQPAPPHHLPQIDITVCCQMVEQVDYGAVQYGSVIPQLATHMFDLQIGNGSYMTGLRPGYQYNTSAALNIIHTVPIPHEDHPSASPNVSYQHYSHK